MSELSPPDRDQVSSVWVLSELCRHPVSINLNNDLLIGEVSVLYKSIKHFNGYELSKTQNIHHA